MVFTMFTSRAAKGMTEVPPGMASTANTSMHATLEQERAQCAPGGGAAQQGALAWRGAERDHPGQLAVLSCQGAQVCKAVGRAVDGVVVLFERCVHGMEVMRCSRDITVSLLPPWPHAHAGHARSDTVLSCYSGASAACAACPCSSVGLVRSFPTPNAILGNARYLRQIAVITPYAKFTFSYAAEDKRNSIAITFSRRTDKMPPPPQVTHAGHARFPQSTDVMLSHESSPCCMHAMQPDTGINCTI